MPYGNVEHQVSRTTRFWAGMLDEDVNERVSLFFAEHDVSPERVKIVKCRYGVYAPLIRIEGPTPGECFFWTTNCSALKDARSQDLIRAVVFVAGKLRKQPASRMSSGQSRWPARLEAVTVLPPY